MQLCTYIKIFFKFFTSYNTYRCQHLYIPEPYLKKKTIAEKHKRKKKNEKLVTLKFVNENVWCILVTQRIRRHLFRFLRRLFDSLTISFVNFFFFSFNFKDLVFELAVAALNTNKLFSISKRFVYYPSLSFHWIK